MRGTPHQRYVEILLEHQREASSRYVDLCISLRVCHLDTTGPEPRYLTSTDEELCRIGGRWDRKRKRWAGEARTGVIVRVPQGSDQEQPARWLAEWFRRASRGSKGKHWAEPATIPGRVSVAFRRVWTLMLVGGRRGGKSHLAVVALVMVCVLSPRTWTWAISPTQDETDELEQAIRAFVPRKWFKVRIGKTNKTVIFKFANHSRILFLSGHKPRALKRGRVDLALYNEAQNMYKAGWRQLRGAIADRGGLVILACNPPDAEIGRWIEEVFEQARAKSIAAEAFHLRGSNNPFVSAEALEDMRREVDEVTARKEIDGEMGVPIGDVVFHGWSDAETVRDVPPHFIDVTAEVTRKHFGRPFGYVVGMDFQKTPHMCAAIVKLFRDPADADNEVLAWIVDEVVVENADEDDLVDGLEQLERWLQPIEAAVLRRAEADTYRGWAAAGDPPGAPVHCCIVADASGWFQDGAHQKGRRSDRALAARNWSFAFKPQKDSDRNPEISERVKITNTRLKTSSGRRRMFSSKHCLRINRAMRDWENNKTTGAPNKHSELAHLCDAVSYIIYRLFGTPKVKGGTPGYHGAGRFKRGEMFGR